MKLTTQSGRAAVSALVLVLLVGAGIYFVENINNSLSSVIDSANRLSAMVTGNSKLDQKTSSGQKPESVLAQANKADAADAATKQSDQERAQFLAQIAPASDFVPSSAEGSVENAPFSRIDLPEIASGQRAIEILGDNIASVAQWYGMTSDGLKQLMLSDLSLHIDRKGRLLTIDSGVDSTLATPAIVEVQNTPLAIVGNTLTATNAVSNNIYPLDQTFKLQSKPESSRIMYLNFKGSGKDPAFDLDKNTGTFSTAEQTMIQKIWARIKEDFSAFDVNITTEPPTSLVGKTGTSIVITNRVHQAGGYAYLNSFGTINLSNPPAFCFQNNLGNSEKYIADCVSHELGHTLGLYHQGTASVGYYTGHGDGETGWAPIMGVGYYKNLGQWAKGEFTGATNKDDAYAIMLKRGLNPRVDDVGNTTATATAMTSVSSNGLNNLNAAGIVEKTADVDVFKLTAGAGTLNLSLAVSAFGGNLDAQMDLLDATGKVVTTSNVLTTLGTTLSTKITVGGIYYLKISAVGKGDPKTNGYSTYGSLGQYLITGAAPLYVMTPPVIAVTTSALTGKAALNVSFDARKSTAMVGAQVTKYEWSFGDNTPASTLPLLLHTYSKVGTYNTVLKITDSNNQSKTQTFKITVTQ
ncbi:PKD domain-containing protein [Undibacterium sp.]|uniref:PKD domain-containing protein n=1 Tax=Undibacterium sp. TaxID=1914977 RepID=UPI003752CC73